jgi:hypothetical protein
MCIPPTSNFRPRPAALWRRSDRGNRVELDGPEGVIIITYQRRSTGDYRVCLLRTEGFKRILPQVDFRRCRYSSAIYGDEDEGCRSGWSNVRQRILDAAGAA